MTCQYGKCLQRYGSSCVNSFHDDFTCITQHDVRLSYTWTVVKIWSFTCNPWACTGSGVDTGGVGVSNISVVFIYVQIECLNVMVKDCLFVCLWCIWCVSISAINSTDWCDSQIKINLNGCSNNSHNPVWGAMPAFGWSYTMAYVIMISD